MTNTSASMGTTPTPLLSPAKDLIHALEALSKELASKQESGSTSEGTASHSTASLATLGRRYEIVIWDVLLPHLIRNAPKLTSDTVTALQDNHQLEKQLLNVVAQQTCTREVNNEASRASTRTSVDQFAEVMRVTMGILESEVLTAFDDLPDDQRVALTAVVEHELSRVDGADGTAGGVSRAVDVLETDRPSMPVPRIPHAE